LPARSPESAAANRAPLSVDFEVDGKDECVLMICLFDGQIIRAASSWCTGSVGLRISLAIGAVRLPSKLENCYHYVTCIAIWKVLVLSQETPTCHTNSIKSIQPRR